MPTYFRPLVVGGLWFAGTSLVGTQMEIEENTPSGTIKRPVTEGEAMGFGAIFGAIATAYSITEVIKERRTGGQIIELNSDSKKQKWFSKYNRQHGGDFTDYYFVGKDIYLTTPKTWTDYRFNDVQDVRLFQRLFPNRSAEEAILRTIANRQVPDEVLLAMFSELKPNPNLEKDLKRRYTLAAIDLKTFWERQDACQVLKIAEIPSEAAKRTQNFDQFELYRKRVGTATSFDNQIIDNIYKNCSTYQSDKLIEWYPDYPQFRDLVKHYIGTLNGLADLKTALSRFGPTFKNDIENKAVQSVLTDHTNITLFAHYFPSSKYLINNENTLFVSKTANTEGMDRGEGVMYNPTKGMYWIGSFANGQLNGANCKVLSSSYNYEGGYLMGKKSGKGKLQYHNLYTYTGDFYNDQMHGSGSFSGNLSEITPVSEQGEYSGKFANGFAHGYGRLSFENGAFWYEGGFAVGRFEGQGTLRFSNGVRFTGPWKNHNPNGKIHVYKYTLLGLIREDYYQEMYSWKDLSKGEDALIGKWNDARADSRRRQREEDEREEAEEKAREKAEELAQQKEQEIKQQAEKEEVLAQEKKQNEEEVNECVLKLNQALSKVEAVDRADVWDNILGSDKIDIVYSDDRFFGESVVVWKKPSGEWYYHTGGSKKGPFRSKDQAMEKVCKIRLKIKD